ncbi:DUF4124 domain-containing protein [Roseateles sp. LYH14W]|uniref:DUF4124 domain-containing protein n=1 Tax=Pelomonas parva TaxID=3299032 RepID=A0ABW7EVT2_9BURK
MKAWMRSLVLGAACCAGASQAQVYKWTDANGKVHYGDRKDAAARQQELKIKLPPAPPPASAPAAWAPAAKASELRWPEPPRPAPPPRSQSGGKEHGTDASRCALAQDILNGRLRHTNGASIDQHDRDIATADVRRFCR